MKAHCVSERRHKNDQYNKSLDKPNICKIFFFQEINDADFSFALGTMNPKKIKRKILLSTNIYLWPHLMAWFPRKKSELKKVLNVDSLGKNRALWKSRGMQRKRLFAPLFPLYFFNCAKKIHAFCYKKRLLYDQFQPPTNNLKGQPALNCLEVFKNVSS